jgi:hypothetical protein
MNTNKTIRVFTTALVAVVLTACAHYWSKVTLRGSDSIAPAATHVLVIDSSQVRDRIHAEELRQAEETQRIRELPRAKPGDNAASKAWLESVDKLVDRRARAAFLSDLKAMGTVDVPATAQGTIVSWGVCECTLFPTSGEHLVKVRFKLGTDHRVVEGCVCSDAIKMVHPI